jgi:hypothetical protein
MKLYLTQVGTFWKDQIFVGFTAAGCTPLVVKDIFCDIDLIFLPITMNKQEMAHLFNV